MNIGIPTIPECNKKKTVEISANFSIFRQKLTQHLRVHQDKSKVYQIVSFVSHHPRMKKTVCFFRETNRLQASVSCEAKQQSEIFPYSQLASISLRL